MPEAPNFRDLASRIVADLDVHAFSPLIVEAAIYDHLRSAWNARGRADLAALEPILGVNLDDIIRAFRALDR
jgi:hypothetical protein